MDSWQLVAAGATAMVTVIGVLWKIVTSFHKEQKERLARYEEKEQEFHQNMRELSSEVSQLVGEREGERRGIETIVKAVTDEIRLSRKEAYERGKASKDV